MFIQSLAFDETIFQRGTAVYVNDSMIRARSNFPPDGHDHNNMTGNYLVYSSNLFELNLITKYGTKETLPIACFIGEKPRMTIRVLQLEE